MTYTIYGDVRSGHVAVEAALIEAQLPYRLRFVSLERNEQHSPAYRAVNPLGRLPALVLPDGTVVTESVACLLALAERHPQAGLLAPPGSAARATELRWLLFAACNLYDAIGQWDYPERFTDDPDGAEAVRRAARSRMREHWRMVEAHLAPDPIPPGQPVTALALLLAVIGSWWGCAGKDWLDAELPRVAALKAEIWSRPKLRGLHLRNFAPLEPATSADEAALGRIMEAAFAPWIAVIGRRPAPMDDPLGPRIASGEVQVLRDGAEPVAAMVTRQDGDALQIDSVAVAPSAQRQGIAGRLVAEAGAQAATAGLARLELYTNARMASNIALWERLGFERTGTRTEHGFERVFFARRLDQSAPVWWD